MNRQMRWILFFIAALALTAVACGLFGGDEEPTAEPASVPAADSSADTTDESASTSEEEGAAESGGSEVETEPTAVSVEPTPEPTEVSAEQPADTASDAAPGDEVVAEALSSFDPSSLGTQANLDSYRFTLTMELVHTDDAGNETAEVIDAAWAVVTDPPAMEMTIKAEGVEDAEGMGDIALTVIDNTAYMVVPGFGCVTSSAGETGLFEDNPFDEMLNPNELFEDFEGAEYVGEEEVNGVETLVFEFDETLLDTQDVEWAEGRVYIAKEGNYLVRLVLDGQGDLGIATSGTGEDGELHLEFNITDINQPVEVNIPEGCEEGAGGTSNVPMLEDAYEASAFGGFTSYRSNATLDEAVEFYESTLTTDGWTKDEESSMIVPNTALVVFTKEADTITVTINSEEDGGTMVSVVSGGGG